MLGGRVKKDMGGARVDLGGTVLKCWEGQLKKTWEGGRVDLEELSSNVGREGKKRCGRAKS